MRDLARVGGGKRPLTAGTDDLDPSRAPVNLMSSWPASGIVSVTLTTNGFGTQGCWWPARVITYDEYRDFYNGMQPGSKPGRKQVRCSR